MSSALGAAVVSLALVVGCGDDDGATQPGTESSAFVEGRFDELPRFPRSEELGPVSRKDDVTAQSFQAEGATIERIVAFYDAELADLGWTRAEPVHREPAPGRADWVRGDVRLEVSAIDVQDRDDDAAAETVVQYSLLLRPA